MMISKFSNISLIWSVLIAISLSSCSVLSPEPTVDANLLITSVAQTVQANLTQTALALPTSTITLTPTNTLTPTTTYTPTPLTTITIPSPPYGQQTNVATADDAMFDVDVTIPDFTVVAPGVEILKTWRILNTGSTTWNNTYQLVYADGISLADFSAVIVQPVIQLPNDIRPNQTTELSVRIVSPPRNGTYRIWFRLVNPQGQFFGQSLSIVIVVNDGSVPVPSATP